MNNKIFNGKILRISCLSFASSVIIAAYGGHRPWPEETKRLYQTAFNHQVVSSVGLVISAFKFSWLTTIIFLLGIGSFSGVLYYRCLKDDKSFNYFMPIGGVLNISGWILLSVL